MGRGIPCALLAVLLLAPARASSAQNWEREDQQHAWMNDAHAAVDAYREGDTRGALAMIRRQGLSDRQLVARRVLASMAAPPDNIDTRVRPALRWDVSRIATLGALHMEDVLVLFLDRGDASADQVADRLATADLLLDYAAGRLGRPSAAPRWKHVIGLAALADGHAWWARAVLDPACRDHPEDAALLLACGSLHETIAGLPAGGVLDALLRHREGASLQSARRTRERQLEVAARPLERLVALDPQNTEARLRLANVRRLQGRAGEAAPMLEAISADESAADARARYLASLFLGRIEQDAGRLEAAAVRYQQASEALSSGQSAYLAASHVALLRGDAGSSAALVDRMLAAPVNPGDPWRAYPLGQHWLAGPLLASLREQARQGR